MTWILFIIQVPFEFPLSGCPSLPDQPVQAGFSRLVSLSWEFALTDAEELSSWWEFMLKDHENLGVEAAMLSLGHVSRSINYVFFHIMPRGP